MKPGFYLGYSLITIITKGSKCRLLATGQGIKLYLLFTASNEYLRNASQPSLVFDAKYKVQDTFYK